MDVNGVMHRKRAWRIRGILKKSIELRTKHRTRRVDFRDSQRPDELACYGRRTRWGWGVDGKVIIERLCISLPYIETFNSKVIKGFVPELRSRNAFFVFRDSYVLCIYVTNILCTFRISVSWVCYTNLTRYLPFVFFFQGITAKRMANGL